LLPQPAGARQREEQVAYRGKNLAEHLETLLCLCPACRRLGTLRSEGDYLRCSCGLDLRFTEYGGFSGSDIPFENILEWDRWQTDRLCALMRGAGGDLLFSDSEISLLELFPRYRSRRLGVEELRLYRDRMEWGEMVFPLSGFGGISLLENQTMEFSFGSRCFEMDSAEVRCLRKYMTLFEFARQPADEGRR
jgi:hypothetical protein